MYGKAQNHRAAGSLRSMLFSRRHWRQLASYKYDLFFNEKEYFNQRARATPFLVHLCLGPHRHLCIAVPRSPGKFYLMGKKPPLYRSFDWQTASKKPWSNALNVLLDTGCVVSLISLNGIALFIVMAILITGQFMLHYVKHRENKHDSAEIIP